MRRTASGGGEAIVRPVPGRSLRALLMFLEGPPLTAPVLTPPSPGVMFPHARGAPPETVAGAERPRARFARVGDPSNLIRLEPAEGGLLILIPETRHDAR